MDPRAGARERGAANLREVDSEDLVPLDLEVLRDLLGGDDLLAVALSVVDGERVHLASLRGGDREGGARVEAPGQEDDRARRTHGPGKEVAAKRVWTGTDSRADLVEGVVLPRPPPA